MAVALVCCFGIVLFLTLNLFTVLLLWASGEMRYYVQLLLRHIFEPGPSLAVVGHCVQTLYRNCANVRNVACIGNLKSVICSLLRLV